LLEQLLNNQNAKYEGTFDSNHQKEANLNEDTPKDEQPHPKETSQLMPKL